MMKIGGLHMTEYEKIQQEQKELERKLDEIAVRRAKERRSRNRRSYCMHTPPEALRRLGERSRNHMND
jgi:hypothetical protein